MWILTNLIGNVELLGYPEACYLKPSKGLCDYTEERWFKIFNKIETKLKSEICYFEEFKEENV